MGTSTLQRGSSKYHFSEFSRRSRWWVAIATVLSLILAPASGGEISCATPPQVAQCQGSTLTCATTGTCTVQCGQPNACVGSTIVPPADGSDLIVNCVKKDACQKIFRVDGLKELRCSTRSSCKNAQNVNFANDLNEPAFLECTDPMACTNALIRCPSNAPCNVRCRNQGCNNLFLSYSPQHPLRIHTGNQNPVAFYAWDNFKAAGCYSGQWLCGDGTCVNDISKCNQTADNAPLAIDIRAATTHCASGVDCHGHLSSTPSTMDRDTFKIPTDGKIKDAMRTAYGYRPQSVWTEPNDPYNLYNTHFWDHLKTKVSVVGSEAKHHYPRGDEVLLAEKFFFNDLDVPVELNLTLSIGAFYNVSSTWNMDGGLSMSQEVEYEVGFYNIENVLEKTDTFTSPFGVPSTRRIPVSVVTTTDMILAPGSRFDCRLMGIPMTLLIKVEYNGQITGCVASKWPLGFRGEPYLCFPAGDIIARANLMRPPTVGAVQTIYVEYYQAWAILTDANTGELVLTYPAYIM